MGASASSIPRGRGRHLPAVDRTAPINQRVLRTPPSDAKDLGAKGKQLWDGLTPQQKLIVSVAVVVVILALALCCWCYTCLRDRRRRREWLATPEMVQLKIDQETYRDQLMKEREGDLKKA